MRLFALLFSLVMILGGCTEPLAVGPAAAPAGPVGPTPTGAATTYLALGDSYTIGEGAGAADRWPAQLAAMAQQQGLAIQAPDIIARTGWTTSELQTAIAAAHKAPTYGLVSLLIGVNNQYRGQSVAQYRVEFRALMGTAAALAGGRASHVFVLSIPDWGQSPFGQRQSQSTSRVSAEIDQFNAAARDECFQAGIAFVDITPLTRAAADDSRQFTSDGLHYTGAQMRNWALLALPVVRQALN
jgi:lysophospholipase L1-like esterase